MIPYRYLMQANPPTPFVYVTLRNPASGVQLQAADQTLVPDAFVQALGLNQLSTTTIRGVGGAVQAMPSYALLLGIHNLPLQNLEVGSHPSETHVLLGRDVLNAHRIVLDGPRLYLEIG